MNAILIIALAGIASLFTGVFQLRRLILPVTVLACAAALFVILTNLNGDYSKLMQGMLQFDVIATVFAALMLCITIFIFLFAKYYYDTATEHLADIYALLLFSLAGAIILVSFNNLVMLFMGVEILSIPLYILAASNRKNLLSNEAGLKYFIMGAFASSFLLLGITFIYGVTGSFSLDVITEYMLQTNTVSVLFTAGCLLIASAFIFKVSAVPFHSWAPDVYEGSPTIITAFMSTVVKTAAFGAFLKFIIVCSQSNPELWYNVLSVVAILTMILGNAVALYQTNLKRMLAYSGIANAGYVMIALATVQSITYQYILFYMASYSIATLVAFIIYFVVKKQNNRVDIDGLRGLAAGNKVLAVTLCFAMLSLAGIPPMAGFIGKYGIFANALAQGYTWLVLIAIINSLIGVYYYFRVMASCFQSAENATVVRTSTLLNILLLLCAALTFVFGIYPELLFQYL